MNKQWFISRFYDPAREQTADLLKGFAVIFMIQVHIMELFAEPYLFESLTGKISLFLGGPPAAPVFMAVMGFYFARSKKSLHKNFYRGILLIAGGILLNIGLNFHLLFKIFLGEYDLNPYHYIFGADILPLAGLSIISLAVLKRIFSDKCILYFITALAAGFISPYLPDLNAEYLQAFLWGDFDWSYFPFFPWFAYPAAGAGFFYLLNHFKEKIPFDKLAPIIITAGVIFTAATILYAAEISHNLEEYYNHSFTFVIWIFFFLIFFTAVVHQLEMTAGKNPVLVFIKWTGKHVTAFYVLQWLIIGNIATAVYRSFDLNYTILSFVIITALISLMVYFWNTKKLKLFIRTAG